MRPAQINLKTERKPAASHLFLSLQFDEQNFHQYFPLSLTNKRYFFARNKEASSSVQIDEQNVRTGRCSQTICLRNLFEAEVCGKFICIWRQCCGLSQRITYSRDTKHTQGFSHCSIFRPRGKRKRRVTNGGVSLSVNNNLIQDLHSSMMIGQISL